MLPNPNVGALDCSLTAGVSGFVLWGKEKGALPPTEGKTNLSIHLSFSFLSTIFDGRNDIYKIVIYKQYSGKGMGKYC